MKSKFLKQVSIIILILAFSGCITESNGKSENNANSRKVIVKFDGKTHTQNTYSFGEENQILQKEHFVSLEEVPESTYTYKYGNNGEIKEISKINSILNKIEVEKYQVKKNYDSFGALTHTDIEITNDEESIKKTVHYGYDADGKIIVSAEIDNKDNVIFKEVN